MTEILSGRKHEIRKKQIRPDDTGGTDYVGRRRENGGSSDHNPIYGRIKMLFKRYPKSDMYLIMLRNRVNKEIQKFGI